MSPHRGITQEWVARACIKILSVGGFLLGAAMLIGGPERFSADGFATARRVPGGVFTWGAILVVAGLVVIGGMVASWGSRFIADGLMLMGYWFTFFAIALGITTFASPAGAVTGPFAYGTFAVLCFVASTGTRGSSG